MRNNDNWDVNRHGLWTRDEVIAMDERFKRAMLAAPECPPETKMKTFEIKEEKN